MGRFPALLLAAGVAATLFPACGDKQHLARTEYSREVNAILARAGAPLARADFRMPQPELYARLKDGKAALDEAADELDALRPPKDAEQANDDLVEGVRQTASEFDLVAASVAANDASTLLKVVLRMRGPGQIVRAVNKLGRLGYRVTIANRAAFGIR